MIEECMNMVSFTNSTGELNMQIPFSIIYKNVWRKKPTMTAFIIELDAVILAFATD